MADNPETRALRNLNYNISRRNQTISELKKLFELSCKISCGVKPTPEKDLLEFSLRVSKADAKFDKFVCQTDDIAQLYLNTDSEIPDSENELFKTVEKYYVGSLVVFKSLNLDVQSSNTSVSAINETKMPVLDHQPRLPAIKIPVFAGLITEFQSFYDIFNSLVHNNQSLSEIEKYHYLITSLSGEALKLIKSIPFDANHYMEAMETLLHAYQNDRLLAVKCINNLLECKPVKPNDLNSLLTFSNLFAENVNTLVQMEIPDLAQFLLFHLGLRLLDDSTKRQFELEIRKTKFPTAKDLSIFLREYYNILRATCDVNNCKSFKTNSLKPRFALLSSSDNRCPICCEIHLLQHCEKFKSLPQAARREKISSFRLCFNCFSSEHLSNKCDSKGRCFKCKRKHHILLSNYSHSRQELSHVTPDCPLAVDQSVVPNEIHTGVAETLFPVLLGTCIIFLKNKFGHYVKTRALCDPGSQCSFMTTNCFQSLGLSRVLREIPCYGLNGVLINKTQRVTDVTVSSPRSLNCEFNVSALIIPKITLGQPNFNVPSNVREAFSNLNLSDDSFDKSGEIQFLIGADLYPQILIDGPIVKRDKLSAFNTVFGYIICGQVIERPKVPSVVYCNFTESSSSLDDSLHKFWELESVPCSDISSPDEALAEKQFCDQHFRSSDGVYNSPILCKPDIEKSLGESYGCAKSHLLSLERRLNRFPELRIQYNNFLKEYLELGHMRPAPLGSGRFSVVTPQSAVPGQGTAVLVYLAGHPEPANVTLRLLGPDRQQVIASNSLQIQGEGTVPLSVPASASGELLLETSVDCGPATSLQGAAPASGSRSLAGGSSSSRSASSLRLVGPLRDVIIRPWSKYYKPGETVEFWVLALDHDLRIATDLTGTVALRDPTGVRVALWEEVPLDQGVRGFSLRLSEEARTGLWSAEVQIGGGGSGSTFSSQLNVSLARGSRDPALPEQPIAEEHFVELAFSKEMRRRYKPGLPFVGKVEAVSSEKGVRVRVKVLDNTTSIYSQDIEMPDGSFLVPAILSDSQRITLQAELVSVGGKETDSHYVLAREEVFKWNSTSSCYLLVESLQPTLQPGDEAKAVVLSSCPCERDLRYLVTTEGHVSYWNEQRISPVRLGSEENISGAPLCRFNFTFTVEAVMAPVSHLLVYYVTDQGEPISDVISFDVKLLQRQVSVNIEQKKFWYPGETMDLQILSDLGSLVCLVGGRGPDLHSQKIGRGLEVEPSEAGVSYYWADLSGREEFRPARSGRHHSVMSEAGLDQLWLWNCFNYTSEVEAQGLRLPGPPEPGKWSLGALSISAATGLRFAYPTLLTVFQPVEVDFRLPQTFRVGESLEVDIRIGNNLNSCVDVNALLTLGEGAHFLGSSQPYVAEKLRLGPHGATSLVVRVVATSPGLKNMTVEVSAYNSETCQSLASELGNHTRVGTVSKVRSILVTPEGLVKTHIESAYFCANEQMVISTSEEFKYEFIPSPHNREAVVFEARAGAGLHVALSEERDTTARMYQVVIGDQGNTVSWIGRGKHGYSVHLLSANSPSILSSDESRTFWLSWDQGVLAFGRGPAVHESVVLKTRREKKMKFNFIGFATNWGQAAEIRVWNYNDEAGFSQVLHLDIPRSVLPGSETGTLVVGGGLSLPSPRRVPGLRPSLSEYSSLATAIASLAPLLADDRVKSEGNQTKSQITSHQLELISELQKLYLFKRKDGSFSDHKNTSSLWNSLEVLDLLSRVQERTRVDPELIVGLKEWILGRQAGDGSFPGHFMSGGGAVRSNMSGMSGEDEAIAVTSFALVTLINVGLESERDSAVMEKARDYLEKRLERTSDGSALGLLCLALATSRSARLEAGLARLRNASTNEEGEFGWPHPLDTSSSSWLVEEGHLKEFRASLFALMTYTKLGDLKSAEAAARYLFYRAYILDTHTELMLSAVKAFSEFGRLAQDPHRWLTVSLATSGMELTDTLELRPRSGVQHLALPSLPTKVFVYATGAGCATVQGEISYATYSAARTTSLFELWAGVTEEILPRRNSIQELEGKLPILNIKTCFKWKGVGSSGVVRLEVHLFSGFELLRVAPNEMDLEYGSRGDRIWFVLYNVSSECAVCLEFSAKSDYVVSRLRPAFARVYPAGRSDLAAELFFHARRGSPLLADTSEDDLITWFGPGRAAGESDGLSSDFSQICACGQVCVDEGEASLSSTTITSAPDKDRGESQSKEVGDDDLEVRKSVDKVGTQEELDKRDGKDKASEMNEESKNIENGTKGEVKKMLSDDKKEEGGMLQQEGIKQVDNGTQGDGDKKLAADKQKQADNEATESNPQQVEDSKQAEESTDFTDIIVLSELKDSSSTTEGEFKTIEELSKELGINATTDGFIFETSHHASTAMDATTQASTTLSPTKAKTFKKELKVSKLKKLKPKSSEIPNEPAHGSPLYKREKHIDIITRNITGTIDSPLTSVQVENKEHITIRNLSESSPEVSDLSEMNSKHLNKELKHLGSSGVLEPLERPSLNVAESAELAKDRGQTLLKDEGEGSLEVLRGQDSEKSQLRSPAG